MVLCCDDICISAAPPSCGVCPSFPNVVYYAQTAEDTAIQKTECEQKTVPTLSIQMAPFSMTLSDL